MSKFNRLMVSLLIATAIPSCTEPPPKTAAESGRVAPQRHPLDALTKDEVDIAVAILRSANRADQDTRFAFIGLDEPTKSELARFATGAQLVRRAFVVVFDRRMDRTSEAVVDLDSGQLASWREIPDVQPPLMTEDATLADRVVRGDEQWRAAIRAGTNTDLAEIVNVIMPSGNLDSVGVHPRTAIVLSYEKTYDLNGFAAPVEGLAALVDLTNLKVLQVNGRKTNAAPPLTKLPEDTPATARLGSHPPSSGKPSVQLRGHEVRWRGWTFRYGFNAREGLVLYDIRFKDGNRDRAVIARASLSELVVPYGGAAATWRSRGPFDVGEFNLGLGAASLEAGIACPKDATMLDVVLHDEFGRPRPRSGVVAIYERDGGVLWRHQDALSGYGAAEWTKELVVTWTTVAGNYDYTFEWTFKTDGAISSDVILNGVVSVMSARSASADEPADAADEAGGHLVADGLMAIHHQHFFCYRIDFDVDGTAHNRVVEVDAMPIRDAKDGRRSNTFGSATRPLRYEATAMSHVDASKSRTWQVVNLAKKNAFGLPTGYSLVPGENSLPLAGPNSPVRRRAGFLDAHIWVTPYEPSQLFAAGSYPNQRASDAGLKSWIAENRPIDDDDVVVWYTLGVTHLPRPEDWPIMSGHRAGFQIKPNGFFTRNPAL